jgi:hypothetical protein
MGNRTMLWAEGSDDDRDKAEDTEAHGSVDETFAERRLRRWLKGMFGGKLERQDRPGDEPGNREEP